MEALFQFIEKNPTVAVSIAAAFFTFLTTVIITLINYEISRKNLNRQLEVQLKTTVEKEWAQKVREHTASINYQGIHLAQSFATYREPEKERENNFLSSIQNLKLFLDSNNREHMQILERIEELKSIAYTAKNSTDVMNVVELTNEIAGRVIQIMPTY